MAGWSSNSKLPVPGSASLGGADGQLRSLDRFCDHHVLLCVGSLNLSAVVEAQNTHGFANLIGLPKLTILNWYVWPLFPMFVIFYVSRWRKPNRPPFDLRWKPNPNWSRASWSNTARRRNLLFMLGEYVAITTMCAMAAIMFLSGGLAAADRGRAVHLGARRDLVHAQVFFMFFLFAMAKAIVPRYRYDQLMRLGWKVFLPLSLAMVVIVAGVLHFADIAPK